MATDVFDRQKAAAINGIDQSRKGSVDEQILELVTFINSLDDYFTTSSCSGRIILLEDQNDIDEAVRKKGCKWLFTSHSMVTHPQKITEALSKSTGKAVFKFEPLVLHVQCRTIECAQHLLCCAVGSGFRNSGISIGNKGKILVAVRSTHGLEAPLSKEGELLVPESYWVYLTELANQKLDENFKRTDRLYQNLMELQSKEHKDRKWSKVSLKSGCKKNDTCTEQMNNRSTIVNDTQDSPVDGLENCFLFGSVT